MRAIETWAIIYFALSVLGSSFGKQFDLSSFAPCDVVIRDFAIVGGGAAGSYAAIALKDQGSSFVVIEKDVRLGGHVATYQDPKTGKSVDYGVQIYNNDTTVRDFFARLKTPLANFSFASFGSPFYADFKASALLNITIEPVGEDYLTELAKYPYLNDGIELPDPVPEDLLLPWIEYISKHNLQHSDMAILARPAVPGHILNTTALYVFNYLNKLMLHEQSGAAVVNGNRDNSQLYRNAMTELQHHILLNSTVIAGSRSTSRRLGVRLGVQTPTGKKLIVAKQLLNALPQTMENMRNFGLDNRERRILSRVHGLPYYGGVVKNTGLARGYSYKNYAANTSYNVAETPSVVMFNASPVDGIFYYWYNSVDAMSQRNIEADARDAIRTLQRLTKTTTQPEPEFLAFTDFGPFNLAVKPGDIKNGFYRDMYALQGYRNTWYIGTLFVAGSSQLWNNIALMLPDILAAAK